MKQGVIFKLVVALVLIGCLGASIPARAEEPLTCSLSVSPLKGDSTVKKSDSGKKKGGSSSGSSTTTFERNIKFKAVVSFHGPAPEKPLMKVWYIGLGDGGKEMIEVGHEDRQIELNEKGRAEIELTSPTTKMIKKTTTTSGGRGSRGGCGGGSTKSTTTGERVTGCVIQVFAGDQLMKSWVTDSRWSKAARNPSFSFELIDPKSAAKKK